MICPACQRRPCLCASAVMEPAKLLALQAAQGLLPLPSYGVAIEDAANERAGAGIELPAPSFPGDLHA